MTLSLNELTQSQNAAWLWDFERLRIVWANEAGVRFWHGDSLFDLLDRRFGPTEPGIEKLGQLAQSLRPDERRDLTVTFPSRGQEDMADCHCTLYKLADGRDGLLVTVVERFVPDATQPELSPQLLGALPVPLGIFDQHGAVLFTNSAAREIFDLLQENKAAAFSLTQALGDADAVGDLLSRAQSAGTVSETRQVETKYGVRVHQITTRRLPDPQTQTDVFLILFEDVTERRAYERVLSETAARLEDFVAAAADFTWEMDNNMRLTTVSAEFEALTGIAVQDITQKSWPELAAKFKLTGIETFEQRLENHKPWHGQLIWPGVNGDIVILLSGVPGFDTDGGFKGYRGIGSRRADQTSEIADRTAEKNRTTPAKSAGKIDTDTLPENVTILHAPSNGHMLDDDEKQAFVTIGAALTKSANMPQAGPEIADEISPPHDQLAAVMDQALVPLIVHRNFELVFVNQAAADLLGFSAPEVIMADHNLLTLFPASRSDLIDWRDPSNEIRDGGASAAETLALSFTDEEGAHLSVLARLAPIDWHGQLAIQMHLALETGQTGAPDNRSNDASKNSHSLSLEEAELRAILNTATDGIITLDEDGKIESFNASAEAIFGYDTQNVAGLNLQEFMTPDSAEKVGEYLASFADSGLASLFNDGREVVVVEKNGGEVPLFLTLGRISADNNSDGGKAKFCAVVRDITSWKKAETDLRRAKDEAESANAQKSDFLAKISHELRTPLNAIIGFSEVMSSEKFGPMSNKRYLGYVNDIHTSGAHLLSLINDLLDLSKIEAGKIELDFVAVDLEDIIQQSIATMHPQSTRQRVIIRTSLAPDLPAVVADQRSMRQIMLNLLSNAIKFTDAGGQVIVSAALDETGEIKLRVRDTGIGMNEEEIERALKPFQRIEHASRDTHDGTGLGLPLTKALIEANRAVFHIESAPESGTLVEITFPTTRVLAD